MAFRAHVDNPNNIVISRSLIISLPICDTVYRFWGFRQDTPFQGHYSTHWKEKVHLPCKAGYQGGTAFLFLSCPRCQK